MNDGQHASGRQTPSQIVAENRSHAAGHGEYYHLTPSQIARDYQLMPHGHEREHNREVTEAQVKPPGMGWREWVELSRQKQGGNGDSDQNSLERLRSLPDEELDHNKGRGR